MKRLLFYKLLVSLLVLLAACSQTQLAPPEGVYTQAQKESYRFRGRFARASFSSSDECSETYVSVFATTQKAKKAGGTKPWAYVYVDHDDWCTDTEIRAYGGTLLANDAFSVSGGLRSASLSNMTVPLSGWTCSGWDCLATSGSLNAKLDWKGTGKISSSKSTCQNRSPDGIQVCSKGTFRNATASGNVNVSVTLGRLNATFTSASSAQIGKSKSGWIEIDNPPAPTACADPVSVPDRNLRRAIAVALGAEPTVPERITCAQLEALTELRTYRVEGTEETGFEDAVYVITDLEGLQYAINLTQLSLEGDISGWGDYAAIDFTPIMELESLSSLQLREHCLTPANHADIEALRARGVSVAVYSSVNEDTCGR